MPSAAAEPTLKVIETFLEAPFSIAPTATLPSAFTGSKVELERSSPLSVRFEIFPLPLFVTLKVSVTFSPGLGRSGS
jgi:hypothetical protein